MKPYKVYYHIPTDQLGIALEKTVLGDLFFFTEWNEYAVLSDSFCNFIDDPHDPESFHSDDFISLGNLE